jgi:hypothetical protein
MSEAWRIFCRPGTNFLSFTSVAIQILLRAGNKSRFTKFSRKQVRGPGLSWITKLSKWQKINAKNVTNLLILLSVLCGVFLLDLIFYHKAHNIYSFYKAKETSKAIFHYF